MQIGDRMKFNYEEAYKFRLPARLPVILRLDGKTFHTFTRGMERPFDARFIKSMADLTLHLMEEISTSQFAYVQSDEISILLHPYKKLDTQAWFNNEIQKMCSVAGGIASSFFSMLYQKEAIFDCRAFVLPEAEVVNYFIWRQQDATRNSITMMAQSLYSHNELMHKSSDQKQEMIFQKGLNWNDLPVYKKRGFAVYQREVNYEIPVFTQDRNFIDRFLEVEEE